MMGFLYRWAVRIKDFGERVKIRSLVTIGLWLREKALRLHINTNKSHRR
jgi:hypothetical protein